MLANTAITTAVALPEGYRRRGEMTVPFSFF